MTVPTHEFPRIDDIAFIRIQGVDAEPFAQAQFMNDVKALGEGRWHWNGWLNAKGRVLALFALLRPAPGELLLAVFDTDVDALAATLARFVFRSRAMVVADAGLIARGEWPGRDTQDPGDRDCVLRVGDWMGLDLGAEGAARRLWIGPADGTSPDAAASLHWRDEDLRHGLPRWPRGREHGWTPHMLSLDRLKAFSVKKGCYPGQEIVARTHFLGQAKRQAWWIEGAALSEGASLLDADGRAVGEVVGATADGRGALVVGALDPALQVAAGAGAATVRRPLAGLARPL